MTRRRRIILIVAFIILLIIILTVLTIKCGSDGYETTLAEWEAAGGARSVAEMGPEPVPDDENAALVYQQIFELIDGLPQNVRDVLTTQVVGEEVEAALGKIPEDVFTLATAAGRMERCDWGTDFEQHGIEALMPHLLQIRTLTQILTSDMLHRASRDEDAVVIERLAAAMNLARHAQAESMLLTLLIGMASEAMAIERFRQAYSDRRSFPPGARQVLERDAIDQLIRQAILGEGVLVADGIMNLDLSPLPQILRQREVRLYRSILLDALDTINEPYVEQDWDFLVDRVPFWAVTVEMLLPSFDRAVLRAHETERQRRAMIAAIDLRDYRDEHGEYPDPATWEMPIDPLTGDPIAYERTDDGMTISAPAVNSQPQLHWDWR